MGSLGLPEMMALFVIALLLFGPKKLPELGRTLGKGLSEFRRAKNELKATLESHMQEIERETRLESGSHTSSYNYPYEEYGRSDYDYNSSTPKELTSEQQAAIEANAAAADPAAHGVPALDELPPVAGTVPRTNGAQPVSQHEHAAGESSPEPVQERHS
jgi:TatA/E family protein of Tat protein translocase